KLHGHRIELGEIHHHLTTHPHLTDALLTTTHHTLTAYLTTGDTDALADPDALIADVRRSLAEALPDYMVPRQYVVLDAFPLTPNGKIDRTALPTPRPAGRPAEPADEPGADDPDAEREPRNDIERRLRDIWAEVLGRESVGVHEVFGDAGGDSLLALRVIARAADAGLTLTPRQFFAHPTVAGLARVAVLAAPRTGQPDAGAAAEAGGEAPLLPGQRMLLSGTDAERNAETVRHHNYALFFSLDAPLDKVALRVALRTLVARHDTLRTGFAGGPEGWRQHVRPAAEKRNVPVEWLDLSGLEPAEQDRTIEEHARRAQRSFDLAEPPLLRVLYADRGPGARPELLLTAHRLVVDNFSLRLLLDELLTAHAQIAEEGEAELPPVSLPASAWARMRAEHAAAPEEPAGPAAPSYGRAGDAETLIEVVDAGAVARLRERARDGATMGDVVLAALAAAARGCGRGGTLRVDVDGHGRTGTPPGSGAAEADLSRTLGRLSVRHRLCLRGVSGPEEAVAAVVAARRAATGGDPDGVREDGEAAGEPPEFLFNHLGAVDELFAVPGLEPSALHPGPLVHPDTPLRHRFELLCGTVEDELLIGLTFPAGDRQEARALLKGLLAEVAAGAPAAPAGRARSQRGRALAEMYRRWLAPGTPG
ncbi:condensation domain-containing protein, partial [Streptomyces sp. JJ36]|uniref:condensation domain-containing protein n=1 Tax=Streptomyces sp. JJ36 TaxID=2736645 RepID=UPI001F227AE0